MSELSQDSERTDVLTVHLGQESSNREPTIPSTLSETKSDAKPELPQSPPHKPEKPARSFEKLIRDLEPQPAGSLGLKQIVKQVVNKRTKKGYRLNILCVGEPSIGKHTLIQSLFDHRSGLNWEEDTESLNEEHQLRVSKCQFELADKDVHLKVYVTKTLNFGILKSDEESWANSAANYVTGHLKKYLEEEQKVKRFGTDFEDTRIHLCLYFLVPSAIGVRQLDLLTMKKLSQLTTVIPLIAKADMVTRQELLFHKKQISEALTSHGIDTYKFSTNTENFVVSEPYAIVGSTEFLDDHHRSVRGRCYPWGLVEVENEEHCDVVPLRRNLLEEQFEDITERTHRFFYETYRRQIFRQFDKTINEQTDAGNRAIQQLQYEDKEILERTKKLDEEMTKRILAKTQELREIDRELQEAKDEIRVSAHITTGKGKPQKASKKTNIPL